MKINPSKSKSISFKRARMKEPLNYTLRDQNLPEDSGCKYSGIIIRSDLSWADQVNHTVQKAWRALHFVMRVVKKGINNTKKHSVQVTSTSDSRIWGCVLGPIQRMPNKFFTPLSKQSG
jgi:hypothetical protein